MSVFYSITGFKTSQQGQKQSISDATFHSSQEVYASGKNTSPTLGACCLDQEKVSLPQYFECSLWRSGGVYTLCREQNKMRTSKPFLFYQMGHGWLWELRKEKLHNTSTHVVFSEKSFLAKLHGNQDPGTDSLKTISAIIPLGKSLKTVWFIPLTPFDPHNSCKFCA